MPRQLVSRAEVWILSNGIGFLLAMILLRAAWMYIKFRSWPLSDMQMLLPAVAIGILLLLNWTVRGLLGQLLGGLAGACTWLLGAWMLPLVSWPVADLPQWMVHASLGFLAFAAVYTSIARSARPLSNTSTPSMTSSRTNG